MDTHLEAKCSDNRIREIKSIDCSEYQIYSIEAKPITWSNHYKLHFIDAYSSSTATRFDKCNIFVSHQEGHSVSGRQVAG